MSKADAYVRRRLSGHDVGRAASEAGFASCPSPRARKLWLRARALAEMYDRGATEKLKRRLDTLQVKLERLREDVADAQDWLDASRLVDQHHQG